MFLHGATATSVFLIGGGLVTIVPLLLFASAVRLVPLSTMGLLQFISPTIQLVLALALYHEPFGRSRVAGFVAVWLALVVFAFDEVRSAPARALEREPAGTRAAAIVRHGSRPHPPGARGDVAAVDRMIREAAAWVDALGVVMWEDGELDAGRIAAEVTRGQFFLAEIDGEPAGAIRFQLEDALFWPDRPAGEAAFVHRLVVRRAFKGHGVVTRAPRVGGHARPRAAAEACCGSIATPTVRSCARSTSRAASVSTATARWGRTTCRGTRSRRDSGRGVGLVRRWAPA